jgi:hypothetical protein
MHWKLGLLQTCRMMSLVSMLHDSSSESVEVVNSVSESTRLTAVDVCIVNLCQRCRLGNDRKVEKVV